MIITVITKMPTDKGIQSSIDEWRMFACMGFNWQLCVATEGLTGNW